MRKVVVLPYSPEWREQFQMEKGVLEEHIGGWVIRILHMGSTAVPGLSAKPVIDIMATVNNWTSLPSIVRELEALGYVYHGENGLSDRHFFSKGGDQRSHHLHLFLEGSCQMQRHLAFKNYLLAHEEAVKDYGQIKLRLAKEYPEDISAYIAGKSETCQLLEKKAEIWDENRVQSPMGSEQIQFLSREECLATIYSLLPYLGHPNEAVRDEGALTTLSQLAESEKLNDEDFSSLALLLLGPSFMACWSKEGLFRRSFGVLFLAVLMNRLVDEADLKEEEKTEIVEGFLRYYGSEKDYRGYLTQIGWGHALAHTGDALLALGPWLVEKEEWVERVFNYTLQHLACEKSVFCLGEPDRLARGLLYLFERRTDSFFSFVKQIEKIPRSSSSVIDRVRREENLKNLCRALYFACDRKKRPVLEKTMKDRASRL